MDKKFYKVTLIIALIMMLAVGVFANQKLHAQGGKNLRSGNMHKSGKRFNKAIPFFEKVLEKYPNNIESAEKLGDIYFSGKTDYKKAYEYLIMATNSINSEIAELKKMQEEKPKKAKKYKKSIKKYLEESEKLTPYIQSCWVKIYKQGQKKAEADDYEGAIAIYDDLLNMAPDSTQTIKMLSYCYGKMGNNDKAIEYLLKALSKKEDMKARAQLASLYFSSKKYALAVEEYKKVIEADSTIPENYYNISLLYNDLGQYENALKAIDKYIELKPEDKDAYVLGFQAVKEIDDKDIKSQIKYYQKFADLSPDNSSAQQYIFTLLYQDKQYDKALEYGEKWYNVVKDNKDEAKNAAQLLSVCAFKAKNKEAQAKYSNIIKSFK